MRTNIFAWKATRRLNFCSLGFSDWREDILSSVKTLVKESFDSSLKIWTAIVGDADDWRSSCNSKLVITNPRICPIACRTCV